MKKAVLSLAFVSILVSMAFAKTQALIRKDGRRHIGLVTKAQGKDGYNVQMRIGEIFVPSSEVDRIEDAATPIEEFRAKKAKLKPTNVKGRYKLAQWAFKKGLLMEASDVLKEILKTDANHERAKLLLEEIDAKKKRTQDPPKLHQVYIGRRAGVRPSDSKGFMELGKWAYENKLYSDAKDALSRALKVDPDLVEAARLLSKVANALTAAGPSTGGVRDKNLLSVADVSRVRLEEFRLVGDIVGVKYRNRVLRRFVTAMSGRDEFETNKDFGRKFMGYPSIKKLQYIMNPDRDIEPDTLEALKTDILVETDPMFMRQFRSKIWPIIKQNCATMGCHGAPEGVGGLKLFNVPARDVRISYTNFVILAGSSGAKVGRVLDRDTVQDSLLLEYLLPASVAKYPHPKTKKNIRNLFKNRQAPAYKIISGWIDSLAAPGYPDYRLEYKAPFGMKLNLSGGGGTLPPRKRPGK
jgi:tetratricopeptide (TPR) repeat protein